MEMIEIMNCVEGFIAENKDAEFAKRFEFCTMVDFYCGIGMGTYDVYLYLVENVEEARR